MTHGFALLARSNRVIFGLEGSPKARYDAATMYAAGQIARWRTLNPVSAIVADVTTPYYNDLGAIQKRWDAAEDEATRATIARDAERLADRVQETMPGAELKGWKRTNLERGETPKVTPDSSYAREVKDTASEYATAAKKKIEETFKWRWWMTALVVGGIVVGVGVVAAPFIVPILTARAGRTVVYRGRS